MIRPGNIIGAVLRHNGDGGEWMVTSWDERRDWYTLAPYGEPYREISREVPAVEVLADYTRLEARNA